MFSKVDLLSGPTPLIELRNLPKKLGCKARIFLKCDDVAPLGGAGNKLRKLEYLVAEALELGADTLVTTGGLQSNHARLTAAVAARYGLACELVLSKLVPRGTDNYTNNGNVLLMHDFGAKLHVLEQGSDAKAYVRQLMRELRAEKRKPYFIPFGGSTVLGALGYVSCAQEVNNQLAAQELQADWVFCPTGSGGTQAGLLAGFTVAGAATHVCGVSVLYPQKRIAPIVTGIANGVLMLLGRTPLNNASEQVLIDECQIGSGYGIPSPEGLEAIHLMGSSEGVILDPVYTGKAFAGLIAAARQQSWTEQTVVVFVHTGGVPGLYAYADTLTQQSAEPNCPAVVYPPNKAWIPQFISHAWESRNGPDTVIDADNIEPNIEEGLNNG